MNDYKRSITTFWGFSAPMEEVFLVVEPGMEVFEAVRAGGPRAPNSVLPERRLREYVSGDEREQAYKTPKEYKEYRIHHHAVRIKINAPAFIFGFPAFVLIGEDSGRVPQP
jgi:hypothetical protein